MATVGEAKVEVVGAGVEWWPHVVEGEGGRQGDLEPLPGQQGGVGVGPLACSTGSTVQLGAKILSTHFPT